MKYIITVFLALTLFALSLVSCGCSDTAVNNGSDTGVSRTDNDVMDDIERGIDDVTDGTVFDANGEHSNVDNYNNNGNYAGDTVTNENHPSNGVTNNTTSADMAYDSTGVTNGTTVNY